MSTERTAAVPQRWWDSDFAYDFRHSPVAIVALAVTVLLVLVALGAGAIAPYNVIDPASANVIDARLPPGSEGMMGGRYLLGTDPLNADSNGNGVPDASSETGPSLAIASLVSVSTTRATADTRSEPRVSARWSMGRPYGAEP